MDAGRGSTRHDREERDFKGPLQREVTRFGVNDQGGPFLLPFHFHSSLYTATLT